MKQITFRAPEWLIKEVDEAAKRNYRSRSQEIRMRLEEHSVADAEDNESLKES